MSPWSARQREWLQALGHEVFVRLPPGAEWPAAREVLPEARATPPAPVHRRPGLREDAAAPARRGAGPERPSASEASPGGSRPRAVPAASPAPAREDPLLRALLRAARCDTPMALSGVVPDLSRLPRDPAAKRALWPRLRALRKARRL